MSVDSYLNPTNVKVYIGRTLIDDAFRVDWQDRSAKTPLYGWADTEYRAVANGRRMVTGSLIVHYRYPGYLFTTISEGGSFKNEPQLAEEESYYRRNLHILSTATAEERAEILMKAAEAGDLKSLDSNTALLDTMFSDAGPLGIGVGGIETPERSTSQRFDSPSNLDPRDVLVNMRIVYKKPTLQGYYFEKILSGVQFVGESQTVSASASGGGDISSSGSPIYEVYSFLAKSVHEKTHEPKQGRVLSGLSSIQDTEL